MAVETRVLVNGEWVTRTVDLNTVLRHHDQQDIDASSNFMHVEKTPVFGMLTQTVIQSPLVHYILPIRLRGLEFNDVAFIGEEFVQIKELRKDGFLWDLARKENFGARIRNARVVGSIEDYQKDPDIQPLGTQVKDEDNDINMLAGPDLRTSQSQGQATLPPQFLLLQLDTGDSVFLMLQQTSTGTFEFVITTRYRVPKTMLNMQPGMHLSVDPSSRYMAVACSESHFSLYALRSREELKSQYAKSSDLQHVVATSYNPFNGTVQKMEFLYPSSDDEGYVVLLMLVIFKGKTRMMIYEWKTGDDIRRVRSLNHKGHLLPPIHQMPLLLIPLKFKSAFILVSEKKMSLFENILEGVPNCSDFYYDRTDPPTSLHHGSGAPLWVGWARPTNRMRYHKDHRDDIYIAREDGLLKFLEIERDDFVESDMNVGDLEGRCGTTLACIDYRDHDNTTGDLLITGGDSCTGGAYLVQARATPLLTQPIENWTPSQDFVTMSNEQLGPEGRTKSKSNKDAIPRPDRIFACVGRGAKGAITEFRYGLEARIGLQFEYELPIMQVWAVPFGAVAYGDTDGTLFLLSIGDSSVALRLSGDETSVEAISKEMLRLDLKHQTIAVKIQDSCIIQVTEKSVVLIDNLGSKLFEGDQLLHVQEGNHSVGLGAALYESIIDGRSILYTTVIENSTYLLLLDLTSRGDDSDSNNFEQNSKTLGQFSARVTSLATFWVERAMIVIVAEWFEDSNTTTLSFQPIATPERIVLDLTALVTKDTTFEAIESMAIVSDGSTLVLLCGTRNGVLLILEIDKKNFRILSSENYRVGAATVTVKKDDNVHTHQLFLVGCDTNAFALSLGTSHNSGFGQVRINQIWFTDAMRPELLQPGVTSIVGNVPSYESGIYDRLLVVAGTQLLLTSLDMDAKAVPRYLKIGGTPTRLIYSNHLDAFVVAASIDGKSTLLFIDPITGEDLSNPLEGKGGAPTKFISGLGNFDERVFRLFEWSYVKGAKTWNFIIASTSTGRLLIISTEDQERNRSVVWPSHTNESDGTRRSKISYYTRHKVKSPEPILSVTGFAEGLLWCSGENLFCDTLDLVLKKFKRVAEYELPSKVRTLEYSNGTIYALTQEHSLEVLDLVPNGDGNYEIVRKCGDQLSRFALDNVVIDQPGDRPLHLISDKMRSFVGLWPTKDTIADTLETVFEGQVSSSILKFQPAKCRPVWDLTWSWKGATDASIPTSALASQEVLGLSVDGSLTRFTVLDFTAWKFLRFLINLCERSKSVCEFTYFDEPMSVEVATDPKTMMHVNGDTLQRCLQGQNLEGLLQVGLMSAEADEIFSKFSDLLQLLHRGSLERNAAPEVYIAQAYADLELYLRPVI